MILGSSPDCVPMNPHGELHDDLSILAFDLSSKALCQIGNCKGVLIHPGVEAFYHGSKSFHHLENGGDTSSFVARSKERIIILFSPSVGHREICWHLAVLFVARDASISLHTCCIILTSSSLLVRKDNFLFEFRDCENSSE